MNITHDTKRKFKEAFRLGLSFEFACESVCLPYSDFIKWIETPEGRVFIEEVKQVRREAIQQMLGIIKKSAKDGDGGARAWLRKHCFTEFE